MKECPDNAKNTVKFKHVSVGQNPFLFTSVELMHFSVATSKRMQDARADDMAVGVSCFFCSCFDAQRKTTSDGGEGEAIMARLTFSEWLFSLISHAASVMNRKGSHVKTIHLQLLELQCRAHTHIQTHTHSHARTHTGLIRVQKADF